MTGVLYYEVIGAVLGFVVGSWVVLGRFRRREVLLEVLLLTSVLEQC